MLDISLMGKCWSRIVLQAFAWFREDWIVLDQDFLCKGKVWGLFLLPGSGISFWRLRLAPLTFSALSTHTYT